MKIHWCIIVALCIASLSRAVDFQGGSGTPDDPYQIGTAQQLIDMGSDPNLMDKCYVLVNDIDLDPNLPGGRVFSHAVIAPDTDDETSDYQGTAFSGQFDGQGFQIRNLWIKGQDYLGLFGTLSADAEVKRFDIEEVMIEGGGLMGSLASSNAGLILFCSVTGIMQGDNSAGGLVGRNTGRIGGCDSGVTVSMSFPGHLVGGLIGLNTGIVWSSASSGPVKGEGNVGGLVGENRITYHWKDVGVIWSCRSTSTVEGSNFVGGLVGSNDGGTILSCASHGDVGGDPWGSNIGGLVGWTSSGSIVASCSTGKVSGRSGVGGLVSVNSGSILMCYSTGEVIGERMTGGLVGMQSWTWRTDKTEPGRVPGIVTASFWDIEASGMAVSDGGTGLTTTAMQDIATYLEVGWDFWGETANGMADFWEHRKDSYPGLAWIADRVPAEPNGAGSFEDPYLIGDAHDLGMVWHRPLAHYRVTTDLDLSGITWSLAVVPWFAGGFDGGDYDIRSLTITGGDRLGLFGYVQGGTITYLRLSDVAVVGTGYESGGLAGQVAIDSRISFISCNGSVSGRDLVGGLVGGNLGTIETSHAHGIVQGETSVGGLVGYNFSLGNLFASCSASAVDGNEYVGGLVGIHNGREMTACYSVGPVQGTLNTGGLVGHSKGHSTISSSYSIGSVRGVSSIGGLVGQYSSEWSSSGFWDTETTGQLESAAGTGLTTVEMQEINTYLDAGWDFIGEDENGTEDIWWIDEGNDYPRLWWELSEEDQ